jgi:pyruvate ferredoxin oxidoreductase gamma subunit
VVFQIRIHGRGGQGVVTAAELLAVAAFLEGRNAQAFPSFGSERTGAPVAAFCRIAERPIRTREPVSTPDCVIVQDATLLSHIDVFAGLQPDGWVLVNSTTALDLPARAVTVAATDLALRHVGRPVPNAVLLGAFAALTGRVRLESVVAAIRERFPDRLAAGNTAAARAAYELVRRAGTADEVVRRAGARGEEHSRA